MRLSAMLTSLPLPFEEAARQAAGLGFRCVDVGALVDRPARDLEILAETGLAVSGVSLGRGLPAGQELDAAQGEKRRAALAGMERQLADAALLGASTAYVVPGRDAAPEALRRFIDSLRALGEEAGRRGILLCLEPVPGRALPTASSVLDLLATIDHPRLAILLDLGHCLITGEDPAEVSRQAGRRLGHVHLNDNDGTSDLHLPLLSGRLTRERMSAFVAALRDGGYQGDLALELDPAGPDPAGALGDGRKMVLAAVG